MSRVHHSIRRLVLLAVLPGALLASRGAAFAAPGADLESTLSGASAAACTSCVVTGLERRLLTPEVAEYSFALTVGPGPHDEIGVHRVVREQAPWVPASTWDGVMVAHGDVWPFDAAFLSAAAAPGTPDHHALPVFLAEAGLDVWGIDFRWTRVPLAVSDLSFMADWGIETDAGDLRIALAVARLVRGATGHGAGRVHLLAWSRGGQIAYAYLDAETRVPAPLRHVAGFIPVDIYLKTDVPEIREAACARYAIVAARIAAGEHAETAGQLVALLGQLAATAPDDPSPVIPGFTNEQAGLLLGSATYALLPPGLSFVPFYHFVGGTFDGGGLPSGLLYSDQDLFFTLLTGGSPWQPLKGMADGDAAVCDGPEALDQPWDDRLAQVRVPVLYVGAVGGFGDYGVYTTTLLGSDDVSSLVVELQPPELQPFDFGHADLFLADDAPTLVWQPIVDWIADH